jgi:arylsulfatase A-like enzyme
MIGAYDVGSEAPPTPNLDALARGGVLFRRAYANPLCSPTRATVQTGRYSFRTGIGWNVVRSGPGLPLGEITLAEMLREHAPTPYSAAAFGKWHLGGATNGESDSPNLAGYSHFEGTRTNLAGSASYFSWPKITNGQAQTSNRYATTDTVDSALEWLRAAPEPWLAYVAFHAIHNPIHAPPRELHTRDVSVEVVEREGGRPWINAMVEAMDSEIGRLLEEMNADVRKRTVVLFLSDNGAAGGWSHPADRAKSSLFEGGINVPFIVSGRVVREPGRESAALVNSTDIFATVAELGAADLSPIETDRALDSVSLLPYLRNPAAPPRRSTVFAEKFFPNRWPPEVWSYAIRNDRYKLIRIHGTRPDERRLKGHPFIGRPEELYDLSLDPGETRNLLAEGRLSPEAQSDYEELRTELKRLFEARSEAPPVDAPLRDN